MIFLPAEWPDLLQILLMGAALAGIAARQSQLGCALALYGCAVFAFVYGGVSAWAKGGLTGIALQVLAILSILWIFHKAFKRLTERFL